MTKQEKERENYSILAQLRILAYSGCMKKLIIVESPTKAKTLSRFLGSDFVVTSSFGHIRDLPASKMGVDIEHGFAPHYVIPTKNKARVTELKKAAKGAEQVIYASDADREGEAIAWHLHEALGVPEEKTSRIVFHEITKDAVLEALKHPRTIDLKMVDAQQARRILDRLVGYELSPFLWKKIAKGLSAGRVQSVAVRLIVEREREILAFKAEEYWTIDATFLADGVEFSAKLTTAKGKALEKFDIPNEAVAKEILSALEKATYTVKSVETKEQHRNPLAPFTTSTLQQEANRRLSFSAKQTMMLAQQLYEGSHTGEGLITYMRTDSVNLSEKFLGDAQKHIVSEYGKEFAADEPRKFTTKSKLAQEAHEAVRPTEASRTPDSLKGHLDEQQWKLYDLIWRRAIASQMSPAVLKGTAADIAASKDGYMFRANGSVIAFEGFMKVWPRDGKDEILPDLKEGEQLAVSAVESVQHFTEPPARFSDASLVKIMEEHGIGRPSTYAPTIANVIDRGYVERIEARRLKPTEMGILVNDVLVEHFPQVVDLNFTAEMEDSLDSIAEGKADWVKVLTDFYGPFHKNLEEKIQEVQKKDLINETEATGEVCEKCGKPMVMKMGRYGKFMACSGFPECRNIKSSKEEVAKKTTGVTCPECKKGTIIERKSKRGKLFFSCDRYPDCKYALWNRPTGETCPKCSQMLTWKKKNFVGCSNKECDFSKTVAEIPAETAEVTAT